jgi:hypothetical protein
MTLIQEAIMLLLPASVLIIAPLKEYTVLKTEQFRNCFSVTELVYERNP